MAARLEPSESDSEGCLDGSCVTHRAQEVVNATRSTQHLGAWPNIVVDTGCASAPDAPGGAIVSAPDVSGGANAGIGKPCLSGKTVR